MALNAVTTIVSPSRCKEDYWMNIRGTIYTYGFSDKNMAVTYCRLFKVSQRSPRLRDNSFSELQSNAK